MDIIKELSKFNHIKYYDEPHKYYIDGVQTYLVQDLSIDLRMILRMEYLNQISGQKGKVIFMWQKVWQIGTHINKTFILWKVTLMVDQITLNQNH